MDSSAKKTKKNRPRLGRGLSALVDQGSSRPIGVDADTLTDSINIPIIDQSTGRVKQGGAAAVGGIHDLPVSAVVPNPNQPRREFDEESLEELAQSIQEHGLMQPIIVRDGGEGRYELIAGERRWRAVQIAGRDTIRAIVMDVDEARSAELALIENIQHEDLNPIERARGFSLLIERFGLTQEQVAQRVSISRPSVANFLRLLELDNDILSLIGSGVLSTGHGKALLSCKDAAKRTELARRAADEGWSVRVLEQMAGGGHKDGSSAAGAASDGQTPETGDGGGAQDPGARRMATVLRDLENRLGEQLSTRVRLQTDRSGKKGQIIIDFYDLDHFDGLLERLGIADSGDIPGKEGGDRSVYL
ncbi:MAG: ParB/RepB/Spo0J family partition protein [Phycisphaerales bacterium]